MSRPPVLLHDFDLSSVSPLFATCSSLWVYLHSNPASPSSFASLPSPAGILLGRVIPDSDTLHLCDPAVFICGHLHRHFFMWRSLLLSAPGFDITRSWLRNRVFMTSFFRHYKGGFDRHYFDSYPVSRYMRILFLCSLVFSTFCPRSFVVPSPGYKGSNLLVLSFCLCC